MTPKEKALELVEKFMELTPIDVDIEMSPTETSDEMIRDLKLCKQCALICVDEMLSLGALIGSDLSDKFYIYWNEVKQEIEKL